MRVMGQPEIPNGTSGVVTVLDEAEPVLTPIMNKEEWVPQYNPQAGHTCENCANRIYDPNPDYVKVKKTILQGKSDFKSIALHLPSRCKTCDGEYTRFKRMKRRTKNIWKKCQELSWNGDDQYRYPKLITFALLSGESESIEASKEISQLKKKMKPAKKILTEKAGVIGGTYVIESTTKVFGIREGEDWVASNAWGNFSHHAHCHMVAVAPYQKDLKSLNTILNPLGLGNWNYKACDKKDQLANYITKYITKGKTRSATWGCMVKRK